MPSAYRAEVIGSLLRPAYLKEARARHAAGAIGDVQLKRAEDHAVDDAVQLQTRAGVSVVKPGRARTEDSRGRGLRPAGAARAEP